MKINSVQIAICLVVGFLSLLTFFGRKGLLIFDDQPPSVDEAGFCENADDKNSTATKSIMCGLGLNINSHSAEDLQWLPGIGPVRAQSIVKSREQDGLFKSLDDLTRIKGIGPLTVKRLEPWLEW